MKYYLNTVDILCICAVVLIIVTAIYLYKKREHFADDTQPVCSNIMKYDQNIKDVPTLIDQGMKIVDQYIQNTCSNSFYGYLFGDKKLQMIRSSEDFTVIVKKRYFTQEPYMSQIIKTHITYFIKDQTEYNNMLNREIVAFLGSNNLINKDTDVFIGQNVRLMLDKKSVGDYLFGINFTAQEETVSAQMIFKPDITKDMDEQKLFMSIMPTNI